MAAYVEIADDLEGMNRYLYERRMTDGLPVIPPTEARVAAMVAGSGRPAEETIGEMPPFSAPVTIEKIAINSVMAGCEPSYMPAVIGAVEALLDPAFGAYSIQTTTNAVGPMLLFNGPIRRALEINCGAGCFGPGAKANATIGRALRLIMLNVGGAAPGDVDKAAMGWPGKFTCCFGENEEESPWEPFHVERGFRATDSTVTLFAANGMWAVTPGGQGKEGLLRSLAYSMASISHMGGRVPQPRGPWAYERVLVLNPVTAGVVAEAMPSKEALRRYLFEHTRAPFDWFPPHLREENLAALDSLGLPVRDGMVPLCARWEDFVVICAGGQGGVNSCGISTMFARAVTRRIPTTDRIGGPPGPPEGN
jgi:hypothetical protein